MSVVSGSLRGRLTVAAIFAASFVALLICAKWTAVKSRAGGKYGASAIVDMSRLPALPDLGVLPQFALVDAASQTFTRDDLAGKVWIADLMFTRCAGQCPMMHGRMQEIAQRLVHADLGLVSLSVDPAYDTPDILATYAARWSARPGQWKFLTGDPGAVQRLALEGLRLSAGDEDSDEGSEDVPATHSVRLVLIDREAHVRGYYDAQDAQAVKRLEADAARLLAET